MKKFYYNDKSIKKEDKNYRRKILAEWIKDFEKMH